MSEATTHSEPLKAIGEAERLARLYAEALFNAAEKQGQTDMIAEEFGEFVDKVFLPHPKIRSYLAGSGATRSEKSRALELALGGEAKGLFLDFLQVVNRHGRLEYLGRMGSAYRELCEEKANRERVLIRTAVPLDESQRQRLSEILQKRLGREPVLDTQVDPDILGGMLVQVGDNVYDDTVASRLTGLEKQLMARSSYAIQHGRDRFRTDG